MSRACLFAALSLIVVAASAPTTVACSASDVCYCESMKLELVDAETDNPIEYTPCTKTKVSYAQKNAGEASLDRRVTLSGSDGCTYVTPENQPSSDMVFVDRDVTFTITMPEDSGYESQTVVTRAKGCGGAIETRVPLKKKP